MFRIGLLICFYFVLDSSTAQGKLARIKDQDGYVNVRQGRGLDSVVIDTIKSGEIFYCFPEKSDWIKVHRRGTVTTGEFDGYVHGSRLEYIDDISNEEKRSLFQKTFVERRELAKRASDAFQQNEPISKPDQKEFDKGLLSNYALLVLKFPSYFCKTKDEETIMVFLETLWADNGSANESPLFEIGACYICEPNLVLEMISKIKSSKKKQYLFQSIEWGLMNLRKEKDPQFIKLKKQLDLAAGNK